MTSPGQADLEGGAFSIGGLRRHLALVEINQFLHQGQPQAAALIAPIRRSICLLEPFKQVGQLVSPNADACIRHRQHTVVSFGVKAHGNSAVRWGELHRIGQQVVQHLVELF